MIRLAIVGGRSTLFGTAAFAVAVFGLASVSPPIAAQAQSPRARFEIGRTQIEAAMQRGSVPVGEAQLKLPARMTASTQNAEIEVESVALNGPHGLRLRLICSDRSACLPFFATATYPASVDAAKLVSERAQQTRGAESGKDGHVPAVESPFANRGGSGPAQMMRAGAPATLQFDAERIHIRIEVICLEGGPQGSRVRVTSLDHKQTYVAQVVAPNLLKGEL